MTPIIVHGDSPNVLLPALRRSRLLVLSHSVEDADSWVIDGASALLRHLRDDAREGALERERTLIVAIYPDGLTEEQTCQRAASVQALRGIVQSVTREFAHRSAPVNLIAALASSAGALSQTIEFLDAEDSYTAGVTIDVTTRENKL